MKVMICGGSIAGLSTAHSLAGLGHHVTLVERAPGLRRGGVAVDVRGDALECAREFGILDELVGGRVKTDDIFNFVDAEGEVQARLRVAEQFYDSPQDIEISRDTLCDILEQRLPSGVDLRFGVSIDNAIETDDGVTVRLSDATVVEVDLLVGADGMHSTVRRIVFGPESQYIHHLGLYVAVLKRCKGVPLVAGTYVYNTPDHMVMTRGDGNECSALLGFRTEWLTYDFRDIDSQKSLVSAAFARESGWLVPAIAAEIPQAADFYFDSVSQIRMPRWTSARTVLVGDAGYCPSFFSGMGTSVAMVGAATLARGFDAAAGNVGAALSAYDQSMSVAVERAQHLAAEGAALLFPASQAEILVRNAQLRAATPESQGP